MNSIKHLTIAPGHPSSNGAAKNTIKSFKFGFKKILLCEPHTSELSALNKYLMYYRNCIHATTGCTPSKLMLGREVNIRFSNVKPITNTEVAGARQKMYYTGKVYNKRFIVGESVYIRDFSRPNKNGWKAYIVDEVIGNSMYICKDNISNMYFKRHVDQIIKECTFYSKIYNETIPKLVVPQTTLNFPVENTNDKFIGNNDDTLADCSGSTIKKTRVISENKPKRNVNKPNKFKDYIFYLF